jgi:putative hydrolase of HD superfamily
MVLNSALANELFRAFYIERWNDRVRPMPLAEMDKNAHKLIVSYCVGKYEEMQGKAINWELIFRDSIFELLRRIVISDIKSPIYQEIKRNKDVFRKLNEYVFSKYENIIDAPDFKNNFYSFLFDEVDRTSIDYRVIDSSHIFSSFWEFQLVKCANSFQHQNTKVELEIRQRLDTYNDMKGIDNLLNNHSITNFIDLCGQLRFQVRWAQTPRMPKTSVLGHTMFVAAITYLLTLDIDCCSKRRYNDFFGGLFHDLPEVVTRDIISPVKRSSEKLDILISRLERELADKEIFPYIEEEWIDELKYFTQNEFSNKAIVNNIIIDKLTINEITEKYNNNESMPYDGEIVRFADQFAAYMEAKKSIEVGITSSELIEAKEHFLENHKDLILAGMEVNNLFE